MSRGIDCRVDISVMEMTEGIRCGGEGLILRFVEGSPGFEGRAKAVEDP